MFAGPVKEYMGMALNRAAFMRKARRLVASFIPFVLAVSSLSAISVFTSIQAASANPYASPGAEYAFDFVKGVSNTVIKTANNSGPIPATSNFTVETWVYLDSNTNLWNTLLVQDQAESLMGGGRFYLGFPNGGALHIGLGSGSKNLVTTIPLSTWTHVALSLERGASATTTKTYIDGVLVDTHNTWPNTSITSASGFSVGTATDGGYELDGKLDQVKIWNGVLSQTDIQNSMFAYSSEGITSNTLRAHYDFNEGSGSTIADRSGNTQDMAITLGSSSFWSINTDLVTEYESSSITSNSSFVTDEKSFSRGHRRNQDGTTNTPYGSKNSTTPIRLTQSASDREVLITETSFRTPLNNSTKSMSIFAWVRPTSQNHPLIEELNVSTLASTPTWNATLIEMVDGKYVFRIWNCSSQTAPTTTSLNQWHHVGITYDGSTMRGFIDGRQVVSQSGCTRSFPSGAIHFAVGSNFGTDLNPNGQFEGGLDLSSLQIYKSAVPPFNAARLSSVSTITFKSNYSGGPSDITQTIANGTTTNLTSNSFTRSGYRFNGWDSLTGGGGNTWTDGEAVSLQGDITLFAKWVQLTAPDAPTIGTAVPGNGSATIPFTAPASNGGSSITSYTATSSPGGFTGTLSQAGSGSISVTGLTNGTAYTFTVTASNAIGTSTASSASNSVTPRTTPGAPTSLAGTVGNTQVALTWTAPTNNGGSAITDYLVEFSTDGTNFTTFADGTSTTPSATVTGLTNGTAYTFRVSTVNAAGNGTSATVSPTPLSSCSPTDISAGGFAILRFTSTVICSWSVPAGITAADVLVVGGGGGAGHNSGGGGSGGGVYYQTSVPISGNIAVTVGAGGAAGTSGGNGVNGSQSSFGSTTVNGGNAGFGYNTNSSGGASVAGSGLAGASGAGGNGTRTDGTPGAAGSAGPSISITGTATNYAGGGGGGGWISSTSGGTGGAGGGGAGGGAGGTSGTAGSANTGGGGGASSVSTSTSGAGGSGVVIVRYPMATLTPTFGTPTATADGFTVQISNFNAGYTWSGTATASGSVAISNTGLVTVTGVAPGTSSTATITNTTASYTGASATVSGTSTTGSALNPTFGTPSATVDGFTVQITNYSGSYVWAGTATASGSVSVSDTGLVTVTGVAVNTSSTATITTARTGYTGGSATVSATSLASCSPTSSSNAGFTVLTFTSTTACSWSVPTAITSVEYLIVGGGGGGSTGYDNVGGSGGGGGMVLTGTISVTPNTRAKVSIGDGGNGGANSRASNVGTAGGSSTFSTITALGGGAALGSRTSGSAGAKQVSSTTAPTGGARSTNPTGGGGATGDGATTGAANVAAMGGAGLTSSIAGGSPVEYGKGGNGGTNSGPTTGASGSSSTGTGGGGGSSPSANSGGGGAGGSGILVIRYANGDAAGAAITTQPSGAVSRSALTTQPVIRIVDGNGTTVTSSTVNVVASIASGTGTLSGTTTVAAVNGVATFTNLVITGTGNHTLIFTPTSLAAATSSSFSVTDTPITAIALTSKVTAPVRAATASTTAVDDTQFTGTVAWFESNGTTAAPSTFAANTVYVAKITLTAKTGYTLTGLSGSFTYTGATSVSYSSGIVTITFAATDLTPRTISFATTAYSKTYLNTQVVTATPSLGSGTVTYDIGSSTACTLSGSTVTISSGTGTCSVSATVASDGIYASATTSTSVTFTISKGVSTIGLSVGTYAYTGTGLGPDSATTSGSTGAVTYAYAGRGSTTYASSSTKPTAVGTYTVTATLAADSNYASVSTTAQNFDIVKADQASLDFTCTANCSSPNTTTSAGLLATYSSQFTGFTAYKKLTRSADGSGTGSYSYSVTNGTATGCRISFQQNGTTTSVNASSVDTIPYIGADGVGTCNLILTRAADANYNTASVSTTITFSKATQSITRTSTSPTSPKNGGTYTPTGTADSGLSVAITISSGSSSVCSISAGLVTFNAAGSCTIQYNQSGDLNYLAASQVSETLVIGKAAQSISITSTAPSSAKVAGSSYTLTATGGASGNAVTFSSTTTSVCTVSTATVSFVAVGTCTIAANQASNVNYDAATQATQSFTVSKGDPLLSSFGNVTKTIGDASFTLTAPTVANSLAGAFSYASGTVGTATIANSGGVGTVTIVAAGTSVITATFTPTDTANYNTATITMTLTVNAIYTVTYQYNSATSGNSTSSSQFTQGGTAITLPTPTKTGYIFAGWFSDSGFSSRIGGAGTSYSPTGATTSITAYARWVGISTTNLLLHVDAANPASYSGSGSTWTDLSGNGNHLALCSGAVTLGGTSRTVTAPTFDTANGGVFNFDSQYDCVNKSSLNLSASRTNFSYFTWIKPSSIGALQSIAMSHRSWANTLPIWRFDIAADGKLFFLDYNGTTGFNGTSSGTLTANQWAYVGFVRNGNTGTFYINGVSSGSISTTTSVTYELAGVFNVGFDYRDGVNPFGGSIGAIHYYTAAISAETVKTNYYETTRVAIAPVNTAVPTVSGTMLSGQTLTATSGTWSPGPNSHSYQWKSSSDGSTYTNISGATSSTYTLTSSENGKTLKVEVVATNEIGNSLGALSDATTASATQYTITLNRGANGTGSNQTLTKTSGVNLTLPNSSTANGYFTRTGYSVTGWTTTDGGSQTHALGGTFSTDSTTTLYPVWTINTQTITYAAGTGGSGTGPSSPTSVSYGSTFTTPANTFARSGYTFAGWSDGTNTYAAAATYPTSGTVSGNVTLTATWTANSLTVTYDAKGGTSVTSGSVNTGASIQSAPTAPTKSGYTLSGWSATDGGTVVTFPYAHGQTANFTLYAIWAASALTVTYDSQGGSAVSNGTVNTGASISTAPTAPTRSGYYFLGWSATTSGVTVSFPYSHGQTSNFTLYAIWTAGVYSTNLRVNLDATNRDSLASGTPTVWRSIAPGSSFSSISYRGTFSPGSTPGAADFASDSFVSFGHQTAAEIPGDITVEAWIKLDANYTVSSTSLEVANHWFTHSDSSKNAASMDWFLRIVNGRLTLFTSNSSGVESAVQSGAIVTSSFANKWIQIGFTQEGTSGKVQFYLNGAPTGSLLDANPRRGSTTARLLIGNGAGTFVGSISRFRMYAQALTADQLKSNFDLEYETFGQQKVTFNSNVGAGSTTSTQFVFKSTSTSLTANPFTRTGYTFSGWATTSGGAVVYNNNGNVSLTADTTLYAVWSGLTHSITFNDTNTGSGGGGDGGTAPTAQSGSIVTSVTLAANTLSLPGYTFAGWATSNGSTTVVYANQAVISISSNTTLDLYPVWTANTLTVTFDSQSGTVVSNGSVATDAKLTAPTAPTRTGYTFSGWSTTSTGSVVSFTGGYTHGQTANFTLYAIWTADGNVVVFNNNSGSGTMSNQSITSGTATSLTTNSFTRTGYTFSGWNTSANGSGTAYTNGQSVTITAGMTLYAQWTGTTNTITYDSKGGSAVSNGSFVTGGTVSAAPTAPTRAGYTLSGWSESDGGSVVTYPYSPSATSGITLYAVWAAVSCSPTSTTSGGYTRYTFTTAGTCFWTVPNGVTDVEVLAVAGGGGGGYSWDNTGAGGGAGGQVKTGTATLNTTVQVTVGAGGVAGTTSSRRGGTGSDSAFGTLTALGGTGGCAARSACSTASQATSSAAANGGAGGSGGASGRGGGGSNTTGATPTTATAGTGTASSYSGSSVTYGAGGNGGAGGAASNSTGTAGGANTGNGGGGATAKSASGDVNGGAGGSGLVIVRVASALTVAFDSQSGSAVSDTSTVTAGVLSEPTAPTRSNYTFVGWFTATSGGSAITFPYSHGQTANFTLYARWALNTYAIAFNANNGSGTMANQSVTHGVAANLNANLFTRDNYVFHRWATNANGTGTTYNNLAEVTLTAGTTLYAQWTANTYVVTFGYNGADGGNTTTTSSFTTGGTAITMPVPTRTGYTFGGWYAASDFSGTALGSTYSPVGTTLSLTVYAKWTAVDYTFTYDANNSDSGSVPTETTKQIGQTATIKANTGSLVRAGYTFAGWNTASNGTGTNYLSGALFTVGSSNVTLYAKWSANTYTVTYNSNGGTGNAQRSSTNVSSDNYTTGGTSVTLPGAGTLERAGYTFAGWNTSADGTGTNRDAAATYTTVSNVILYAKWSPVTYSVTYNGNTSDGGTAPTTGSYTTGQASPYTVLSNTFTKSSNVFGGWNTAADGTGTSYSPGATFTTLSNVTLYATWIPQFTLHYAVNGGTVSSGTLPADRLYNSGTSVGPVFSAMERAGYTFDGWTNGANTIAPGGNFTILADSVLTAKWTPIIYTISYNSDGGTDAPAQSTKQIGQSHTVGSAVSKPGYNFTGWSNGSSVVGPGANVVVGTSNVSFTAQWSPKVYRVSYDWNGGRGTAVSDVDYTFGNPGITLPVVGDRVKDGYNFAGWAESANGSALGLTYTPSQSRTLYALWTLGNFTVTYNAGRGTVANSTVAVQNGSSTVLPLPTRSNFVFDGWHTSNTGGSRIGNHGSSFTPAASQTFYARWIQSSLYGISDSLTRIGSVITSDNVSNTFSGANSNSSVSVSVPANAFAAGTTINFDLVGNSSRATGLISGINYIVSIAVSWLTGDETVPDTASGKPISVTITNSSIKAGAVAYAIVNNVSTLLGTATQDGTITVTLTSDPEIVVAATKPGAPTNVSATSNGNQQSVISWSAPSSDGGAAITAYTVTANTGATCTTNTTSCTISSLTNGTAYTFTVKATNTVGDSVASSSASATTASLHAVAFDAKGGSTVSNGSFLTASTVSEPTAPTRAGYSFAGWAATDGGTVEVFPYAPGVTSNITMYAKWDALDNNVTFDAKGGSSVTASVFASGGTVAEPAAPTRSGYTFAGWSTTDGGTRITFPYAPGVVTDITLYARWTAVSSGGGSNNSGGGSSGGSSSSSSAEGPVVPVKSNVTVVAPVTVVGDTSTKIPAVEIFTPAAGSNVKPPAIKIDAASEKFIADFKVVEGKLVLTPETGFSGKRTVTVTVTENGADRFIQIPLTVLPEVVEKPVLTPTASNKTIIRWTESPNATAYTVLLNGKRVCSTSASSCSVKQVLGPDAVIEVISNGGDRTVSEKVEADFRQNVPVAITRIVSATITKATLTRVDTKALDKVIVLIRTQGFGTVVISEITTTKKTATLATARIAAIMNYIDEKTGSRQITFEVVPAASRTYFNNISVKG